MQSLGFILGGLGITASLLSASLAFGVAIGWTLTAMRLSRVAPLQWFAVGYIEVMRGIPLLVLLLFIYFGLQGIVGREFRISEFWAAVTAFGVCYGAYLAEVFRAGIESVDAGQTEAARALGLTSKQTMRHVVAPQAIRNILPAFVNESVALLKDSSLASVIAIPEITQRARLEVARTYDTFGTWGAVAALYLILTFSLSSLARLLERRRRRVPHPHL